MIYLQITERNPLPIHGHPLKRDISNNTHVHILCQQDTVHGPNYVKVGPTSHLHEAYIAASQTKLSHTLVTAQSSQFSTILLYLRTHLSLFACEAAR